MDKDPKTGVKEEYLKDVLLRSSMILFQALKLGKAFERQKLGRRQKTARLSSKVAEVERLEGEVHALKKLDLYNIAEIHLFKSILKIKSFSSKLPWFIQSKVEREGRPPDAAHANVQARLFNSHPVKTAMDQCIGDIRSALGLTDNTKSKKKRLRKIDFHQASQEQLSEDDAAKERQNRETISDVNSVSTQNPTIDFQKGSESEIMSINSGDYNSRPAELSYGSLESNEEDMNQTHSWESASQSTSPTPFDLSIDTEQQQIAATKLSKPMVMTNTSSFFPSLMGGYWSGSGSDGEENIMRNDAPKRNRRGQRARRWIAEQKFGQNANHVKKQQLQKANRDDGWDLKKGAQPVQSREMRDRERKANRFKKRNVSGGVSSGANSYPVEPHRMNRKSQHAETTLHPSWEAARKAKEQKTSVAFQGKKVVFD
ncbi:MAG: hypothetical protein Q9167_003960 [Letrouitia subvulpina]